MKVMLLRVWFIVRRLVLTCVTVCELAGVVVILLFSVAVGGGARKKTPRKRGKQVLMESALDSIIVHIVEMEAPLHIQSQLLQLLSQVDNKVSLSLPPSLPPSS